MAPLAPGGRQAVRRYRAPRCRAVGLAATSVWTHSRIFILVFLPCHIAYILVLHPASQSSRALYSVHQHPGHASSRPSRPVPTGIQMCANSSVAWDETVSTIMDRDVAARDRSGGRSRTLTSSLAVPGSREEWPASGTMCSVISGHTFFNAYAVVA